MARVDSFKVLLPCGVTTSAKSVFQEMECKTPEEVRQLAKKHSGAVVSIDDPKIGRHYVEVGDNGKIPRQLTHLFRRYVASHCERRATRGAR